MNYPYQIVAFLDVNPEPAIGTPIYNGPQGWIPNVALKRRFGLHDISESDLIELLKGFFDTKARFFGISFTRVAQPEDMPVNVLEIERVRSLMIFHRDLIAYLGNKIESRYPERDGENYYPHMTLTWQGKQVVDPSKFLPTVGQIGTKLQLRVCLVKDPIDSENAEVFHYFDIKN